MIVFIVITITVIITTSFMIIIMQGDVLCAEALNQILVTRDGQSRLLAAFIHRVVPLHQTVSTLRSPRSNKLSWLATWRDRNIFLHRTHVGMAVQVWYTYLSSKLTCANYHRLGVIACAGEHRRDASMVHTLVASNMSCRCPVVRCGHKVMS